MAVKNNWQGLGVGLICTFLFVVLRSFDPAILTTLRNAGFDTLQTIWPRSDAISQPVRIVDIDEASLAKLGQWPWPRSELAKLVDELNHSGASAIVFDMVFPEPDRAAGSNDGDFAAAIKGRPVVSAFATSRGPATATPQLKAGFAQTGNPASKPAPRLEHVTKNLDIFDDAAAGIGSMNIDLSKDQGVTRQIPLLFSDGKQFFPSLDLEALRVAQAADTYIVNTSSSSDAAIESIQVGEIEIPTSDQGQFQIYYRPNDPKMFVSAADVIDGQHRENLRTLVNGHMVVIGTSAVGLLDMRTSALGEDLPGVAVHAQALEQILSGAFLSRPEWATGAEFIGVVLSGFIISLMAILWRPLPNLLSISLVFVVLAGFVALAFRRFGILIDFTFPAMALATTFLSTTAYKLLVVDRQGRQLRRAFSHYVAPSVLAEIEKNPTVLNLGGELREVTVMFVDIANFTPLSEKLEPQILVQTVNTVLETCSAAILSTGGTIDKYIGDAVMAFWNAPLPLTDHQYHAALAGINIQTAIDILNTSPSLSATLIAINQWPLSVRIGFASGISTVGNMGSSQRFDYSVLGEAVNTAARAEQACKHVGHNIILAGNPTAKTATLAMVSAGSIVMKGKGENTPVFAILGEEAMANTAEFQKMIHDFHSALPQLAAAKTSKLADSYPGFRPFFERLPARKQDYNTPKIKP